MGNGPGCFALGVCLLCLAGTVKFSRLPVLGLGENGLALSWLLMADGVFILLAVTVARWFQTCQWQEFQASAQETISECASEEEYAGDGHISRDVDAEWDAWFTAFDAHFADARRGETWPHPQVDWRGGGSAFGDLPGHLPRNPPPDDDGRRPPSQPTSVPSTQAVELDGDIESWIDEQFDRVLYRNNSKEA